MCSAKGVNLIVVPAGGEVFEDAQEVIIPMAANNLNAARFRLCAHGLGPRLFVPTRGGEADVAAVQCASG